MKSAYAYDLGVTWPARFLAGRVNKPEMEKSAFYSEQSFAMQNT